MEKPIVEKSESAFKYFIKHHWKAFLLTIFFTALAAFSCYVTFPTLDNGDNLYILYLCLFIIFAAISFFFMSKITFDRKRKDDQYLRFIRIIVPSFVIVFASILVCIPLFIFSKIESCQYLLKCGMSGTIILIVYYLYFYIFAYSVEIINYLKRKKKR